MKVLTDEFSSLTEQLRDEMIDWLRARPRVSRIEQDGSVPESFKLAIEGEAVLSIILFADAVTSCHEIIPFEIIEMSWSMESMYPGVGWRADVDYTVYADGSENRVFVARQADILQSVCDDFQRDHRSTQIRALDEGRSKKLNVLVPIGLVEHREFSLDDEDADPFA